MLGTGPASIPGCVHCINYQCTDACIYGSGHVRFYACMSVIFASSQAASALLLPAALSSVRKYCRKC